MTTMDLDILKLVAKADVHPVFEEIVKRRRVRFKDLTKSARLRLDRGTLTKSLHDLEHVHVIKVKGSPVDDFKTYYVTAKGLEMERKAKLMGMA